MRDDHDTHLNDNPPRHRHVPRAHSGNSPRHSWLFVIAAWLLVFTGGAVNALAVRNTALNCALVATVWLLVITGWLLNES